jgi:4-hydroxy-4-methyl-2-oxoglutarate aldolase
MYELGVVYRNITRADAATADALARWAAPRCTRPWAASACCKPYMRPIYAGAQVGHGRHRAAAPG